MTEDASETGSDLRANAALTIPVPRVAVDAFVPCTFFVVVLAMLFGGGARQGLWSDALVQWASLPLLVGALFKLERQRLDHLARWAVVLMAAIVALPLLQLIPLPPALWTALPGRHVYASTFASAGIDLPWLPLSLDPAATWSALFALIPAIAVFLAILSFDKLLVRILVALVLLFVLASVPIDLLQMMDGPESPLRFYAITNTERAVGLFANSNHNAAFLYCGIPFAAAWAFDLLRSRSRYRTTGLGLLALLFAAVMVGLALTQSRAGIALGILAGLSCLLLAWRHERGKLSRRLLFLVLGANAVALLIAFQFGFVAFAQRAETGTVVDDIRWSIATITVRAALANLPLGTGLGTFVPIYEMFAPLSLLRDRYINHAHNDWLELWLVGGVPALLLVCGFFAWFVPASVRAWSRHTADGGSLDYSLARAASLIVVLLLIHSLVDYPLRTISLSVLFALACGLLSQPAGLRSASPAFREN